jgi:uncharacterized protein
MKSKKYSLVSIVLFISLLLVSACGNQQTGGEDNNTDDSSKNTNLSIAARSPGPFHNASSAIASVINDNSSVKTTVRTFADSNSWIPMIDKGEVDIGFTSYTTSVWAFEGTKGYEKHKNIRTLLMGNQTDLVGYIVLEDSEIKSLKDLKGKKVATFPSDVTASELLKIQLKSVGLTEDDVQAVPFASMVQALDALREGRIDAAFSGGPNVAHFLEADNALGLRGFNLGDLSSDQLDQVPQDLKDYMLETIPGLQPKIVEGGFLDEPIIGQGTPLSLIASAHVSEEDAYEVVKTIWEKLDELAAMDNWLKQWTPETMFIPEPSTPYHPGAVKYFKEIGIWTDEAEEHHQKLMSNI